MVKLKGLVEVEKLEHLPIREAIIVKIVVQLVTIKGHAQLGKKYPKCLEPVLLMSPMVT